MCRLACANPYKLHALRTLSRTNRMYHREVVVTMIFLHAMNKILRDVIHGVLSVAVRPRVCAGNYFDGDAEFSSRTHPGCVGPRRSWPSLYGSITARCPPPSLPSPLPFPPVYSGPREGLRRGSPLLVGCRLVFWIMSTPRRRSRRGEGTVGGGWRTAEGDPRRGGGGDGTPLQGLRHRGRARPFCFGEEGEEAP